MSVPPNYAGLKLSAGTFQETQHTLELCMAPLPIWTNRKLTSSRPGLCMPAKMFETVYALSSTIAQQYSSRLRVIFRQHIQPWHPSSTLTHEAGAAVLRLAPEKFWEFSAALFKRQTEFFDVSVVNETRNKTYERLSKIAGSVGVDEAKVLELLVIPEKVSDSGALNVGNQVTNDIKWMIKTDRVIGVHVSPTVFFNGVEERSISSSFTAAQWGEWLAKNVV